MWAESVIMIKYQLGQLLIYLVGGRFYKISRPLTPPCVPFGTRRFSSFHIFAGNSWSWAYSLDWLFLYSLEQSLALVPLSMLLCGNLPFHAPSTLEYRTALSYGILSLLSSIVSSTPLLPCALSIRQHSSV